jgi:DNA polymerase-3 subunit alpha (Gram-positive type)
MSKHSEQLIQGLTFCVFDLETTGPNHEQDKIIEIGLVKIQQQKIVETKQCLINPEIKIPKFIQKLTSITNKDVKDAPLIEDVIHEILDFMGDAILVAHNISFDVPFFNAVLKRLGLKTLKNKGICTNLMTRYLIPSLVNSNLNYMCMIFDIPHEKAHRALDDSLATTALFLKYLDVFIEKDIRKTNQLYYPKNHFELDRKNFDFPTKKSTIFEDLKNLKVPYVITVKGEKGILLFALPCRGDSTELIFIENFLKQNPWVRVTIKLYGHYIEALMHFFNIHKKLAENSFKEIINFIVSDSVLKGPTPHCFIIHHLIPGQYVAFKPPFSNSSAKLIFTYPAQKKKLFQFLKMKSKLGEHSERSLRLDLKRSLNYVLSKEKEVFLVDKKMLEGSELLFSKFNQYTQLKAHKVSFPKEHI